MDLLTVFGLLLGLGVVYYVMLQGEITALLFNFDAFLLVFGGTFASTMITYPWDLLKKIPRAVLLTFFPQKQKGFPQLIEQMVSLQTTILSRGIDGLSNEMENIDDKFLKSGIRMLIEDQSPETIKENLNNEIEAISGRHQRIIGVFRSMGSYAPIFGLLGTLIGVVQVLRTLGDPTAMGGAMAIAITTTFYGIFGCNFIFLPIAGKLNEQSDSEILSKELIRVGILSIKEGIIPVLMRKKLNIFFAAKHRS